MNRQSILQPNGELDLAKIASLQRQVADKARTINDSLAASTEPNQLQALISQYQAEVQQAIVGNDQKWRSLFPGRRLLEEYARSEGLGNPVVLQNNLIKELAATPEKVAPELRRVIQNIVNEETLS